MNVLVCIKRVPAPGAKINLTEDQQDVDTRHLGFAMSPHEECAVEEAVRLGEQHGGTATVLALGPPTAYEQIRQAMAFGIQHGVLVETGHEEWDPQATASAISQAIEQLQQRGEPFDLILFGNESADAANHQVGIRVAHALDLPVVAGVKGIELSGRIVRLKREVPDGLELCELDLPVAATVKEGINLPRYPSIKGRLRAAKAEIACIKVPRQEGGLYKLRLKHPPAQEKEARVLGKGPEAAPAVVDVIEELGLL